MDQMDFFSLEIKYYFSLHNNTHAMFRQFLKKISKSWISNLELENICCHMEWEDFSTKVRKKDFMTSCMSTFYYFILVYCFLFDSLV